MMSLYPQNGDRIVIADSVTSLHAMYIEFGFRTLKEILPDNVCFV